MRMFRAAVLGGLFLLGAAAPGTALAAAGPAAAEPVGRLALSVTTDAPGATVVVELTCDPDGGTHPDPAAACKVLRTSSGDLTALRPDGDYQCFMLYDPHTVRLKGHWQGREVSYEKTFANSCEMKAITGAVFDF